MARVYRHISSLLIGLPLLIFVVRLSYAQTSVNAFLTSPNTEKYPRITTYLDIQDSLGFVQDLQLTDVSILENDVQLPASELSVINPGARLVVAISPGPSFTIRDNLGNSRYNYLVDALRVWSGIPSQSSPDDLSLIAAGFPEALNYSSPQDWFAEFNAYQPDADNAKPTLDTLARALDVAGEKTPRAGMGRVVLFITSPPESDATTNLQDLVVRAQQNGIHIFVWLVAVPEAVNTQGGIQLQNLASQTGGKFFIFSGVEIIPNPEEFLQPMRYAYAISYESKITTSGTHQLLVEVNTPDIQISTPPCNFELKVYPPNPIFVSLPASILRTKIDSNVQVERTSTVGYPSNLEPVEQTLEVLIEFPDGYTRALEHTALYVDGALVSENNSPPFEKFTWDLTQYIQSGKHLLRVEAVDILGLTGTSIDAGVKVMIQQPPRNLISMLLSWQNALLAGLAVLAAGVLVILLLVLGGRLRPRRFAVEMWPVPNKLQADRKTSRRSPTLKSQKTQEPSVPHLSGWLGHLQLQQHRPAPKAPAFLVPYSEAEDHPSVLPIPITANVITLGRDALRATLVLDDGSVEGLHARLQRENGSFRLIDLDSVAGTWVNYTPVSQDGTILEHGDLIHIGRISFRFTLREAGRIRKPIVIPLSVESETHT